MTTPTETTTTELVDPRINQITKCLTAGLEQLRQAGQIVVDLLSDGHTIKQLAAAHELLNEHLLRLLERVGRGQIVPELVLASYSAAQYLRRMTPSDQLHHLSSPIEVLTINNGSVDTRLIPVRDLSPEQVRQVFDYDHVRAPAAQRTWLETQSTKIVKPAVIPYRIIGKGKDRKVVIPQPTELDMATLLHIVSLMQQ